MEQTVRLGVARKVITPKVGGQLYGYTPDIFSESVYDDLTLSAFCFEDEGERVLFMSATVCLIKTELYEEIASVVEERFGIPKDHVILHATHTHSGPNLAGEAGWGDLDREYYEAIFLPALLSAVEEAMGHTVPVKMGVASGHSEIAINRRELHNDTNQAHLGQNPWGPFDPQMTVLSFKDLQGNTVANLVHYGMHGTCAGQNHEITRDWSGLMIDAMERESEGITAFFNGPEGDVGPRLSNGKTTAEGDNKIQYVEEMGAIAAADALRIFQSVSDYQPVRLSFASCTVDVPLTSRIDRETAEREYEKYKDSTVNLGGARAVYYRTQLRLYEEGYADQAARRVPQSILRIGDVAFASFPYELFSVIGMRIARESEIPYTLSLSNTNGSEGYMVTEDQICRSGYEVKMFKTGYIQPYADNADWHLVTQTVENLKKISKKGE
ncbi:MAG: neutral/alkaline non-lysosomal ceramidase N-terminal domain-containing protein [Clostridia bacterium]|nr:neutral/alkaline non-lysosomal ceramidase N-terminal domain-containing protein [Clostridia bacterium]